MSFSPLRGGAAFSPIVSRGPPKPTSDGQGPLEQERRRQGEERDRLRQAECDRPIEQDAVRERLRKKDKTRMKALMALWNEAAGVVPEDHGDRQDRYGRAYQ